MSTNELTIRPRFGCPLLRFHLARLFAGSALICLGINLLGKIGQFLIGLFFFFERLFEQRRRIALAHQLRIGTHRTVRRDFVMLHSLRGGNDRCVHHGPFVFFRHHFGALRHDPFHAFALLAFYRLA